MSRSKAAPRRSIRNLQVVVCAGAIVLGAGCAPELPQEPAASFVELEFDPGAGKSSQPTSLVMNAETGLIDLSQAGIEVPQEPGACSEQTALSVAQCELYQYLERLDGFPTLASVTTPVSAPIDLSTASVGEDVVVRDLTAGEAVDDLELAYDADFGQLRLDHGSGWELGHSYLVGVRGYDDGLKSESGAPACASIVYVLLKGSRSLSCGATRAEQIDARCEHYALFASDARFAQLPPAERRAAIAENLLQLERLRRYYRGETPASDTDLWATLEQEADMAKAEVAIGWLFPVHGAPVVELDPTRGMVPEISGPDVIRLAVKGTLDAGSLSAFSLQNGAGNVFVLNVDVLQDDPLDPRALPPFEPSVEDGRIVLTATDPDNGFVAGATYAVLLTDELTGEDGEPIVASPVTVLLRSRGALVDDDGKSQVAGVADADAMELEQGRARFAALLDDPTIKGATTSAARPSGLTRERIAYLFGFTFETAEQASARGEAP